MHLALLGLLLFDEMKLFKGSCFFADDSPNSRPMGAQDRRCVHSKVIFFLYLVMGVGNTALVLGTPFDANFL